MLIHIGYHKTASSWLQHLFFPHHRQLRLAHNHETLWSHLIEPNALDFSANNCRENLQPVVEKTRADGLIPILSAERLSGNPHSGGYDSQVIAWRLSEVFPDARILIVVRRQADMLRSLYKQYVRAGGICSLSEYLDPVRDGRMPLFRHQHLCYHRLVACYKGLFGKERVLTLPYEQLASDQAGFLESLCEFMDIEKCYPEGMQETVAASDCDLAVALKRRVNRWHGDDSLYPVTPVFPWLTRKLFAGVSLLNRNPVARGIDCHYREYCENYAEGKYEDSNQHLRQLINWDPDSYAYAL
jgi:Sulfotransferase family